MTEKLQMATKWLTDSDLKVNESKTKLFKFHRTDTAQVEIIKNNEIKTINECLRSHFQLET